MWLKDKLFDIRGATGEWIVSAVGGSDSDGGGAVDKYKQERRLLPANSQWT